MKKLIIFLFLSIFMLASNANAKIVNGGGNVGYPVDWKNAVFDVRYRVTLVHLDIQTDGLKYTVTFPQDEVEKDKQVYIKASKIATALESQCGVPNGIAVMQTLLSKGGSVNARATIEIYNKNNKSQVLASFNTEDQIDPICKVKYNFGAANRADMRTWFPGDILDQIPIDIPLNTNIKAEGYLGNSAFTTKDILLSVGMKVKNDSDDTNKAFSGVHFKVTITGADYNKTYSEFGTDKYIRTVVSQNSKPSGQDFYFQIPSPMIEGPYTVTLEVNDNREPKENKPNESTAYNDNIVTRSIAINNTPNQANGFISLKTYADFTGFTSGNKIKSGYGFGIQNGFVKAEGFPASVPTWDGFISLSSATIHRVDNFKINITNGGRYIPVIVGLRNGKPNEISNIDMKSDTYILSNDFSPKNVNSGAKLFNYWLNTNNYSSKNKNELYLSPNTRDDNHYQINIGDGATASVTYHWYSVSYYLNENNEWETFTSNWDTYEQNTPITPKTFSFEIKGSMFDDDQSVITR